MLLQTGGAALALAPAKNGPHPENPYGQEGEEVDQQIPASVARRRYLDVGADLPFAQRALHANLHTPEFLPIKRDFGFILHPVTCAISPGIIMGFGEPSALWLHGKFHLHL